MSETKGPRKVPKSSFAGFTCWESSDVNDQTMPVDAASPSNELFLATHQPARILRRVADRGDGEPCTEGDVLAELTSTSHNMLLLPIVGRSGTGKSHLVRWLAHELPRSAERHVVYIEKHKTSLLRVIELILDGASGSDFDAVRDEVRKATRDLTVDAAAKRLLFELKLAMDDYEISPDAKDFEHRTHLRSELPKLLTDHIFETRMLRNDSVVKRLVGEALAGRSATDKEHPFRFGLDDIPSDVADIQHASSAAKAIYTQLLGIPRLKQTAIEMINERLDESLRHVFGLPGSTLYETMIKLRGLLHRQGKQLYLFIEDFTLLQGIQRSLLDALIETPIRDGKQVLCSIRTVMAVTTGYFETLGIETARTRTAFAAPLFSLDVPYGEGPGTSQVHRADVEQFASAYLNAVRLGADRLRQAYAARDGDSIDWVPNYCEGCDHIETCHASFGKSRTGYGLYPFNSDALRVTTGAVSPQPQYFDPRAILGRVLRYTLEHHRSDIRGARFPNQQFATQFENPGLDHLSPAVEREAQQYPDAERRAILLTFWGGNPQQLADLAPGIHEAFQIPRVGIKPTRPTGRPTPGPTTPKGSKPPAPDPVALQLEAIERWRHGSEQLEQQLGLLARTALAGSILVRAASQEPSFSWKRDVAAEWGWGPTFVDPIRLAGASERHSGAKFEVTVERSVESQLILSGIAQVAAKNTWAFDTDGSYLLEFAHLCDAEAERFMSPQRRSTAKALARAYARIVALEGLLRSGNSNGFALRGLIERGLSSTPNAVTTVGRGDAWQQLVRLANEKLDPQTDAFTDVRDRLLRTAGIRQGDGTELLLDPELIDETHRDVFEAIDTIDKSAPAGAFAHARKLRSVVAQVLATEFANIAEVARELDGPDKPENLADAAEAALTEAHVMGLLHGELNDVRNACAALRGIRPDVLTEAKRWSTADGSSVVEAVGFLAGPSPQALTDAVDALHVLERARGATAGLVAGQVAGLGKEFSVDAVLKKCADELVAMERVIDEWSA